MSAGIGCACIGWWLGVIILATLTLVPLVAVCTLMLSVAIKWEWGALDIFVPLGLVEGAVEAARACPGRRGAVLGAATENASSARHATNTIVDLSICEVRYPFKWSLVLRIIRQWW